MPWNPSCGRSLRRSESAFGRELFNIAMVKEVMFEQIGAADGSEVATVLRVGIRKLYVTRPSPEKP